jgi:hypothetical protein
VAQRINLVPNLGVYIPTTELIKAVNGDEFRQEVSFTVGGQLDIRFGNRFGVQGTGSYAPSALRLSAAGVSNQTDANIFTGTGRVLVYLVPETSPVSFLVTGGVAWINRSGTAYADVDDRSDVGGAVGAAVALRLGPILNVRVTADSFIYNSDVFAQVGEGPSSTTQRDVQLSFGFGIPLIGLGGG